MQTGHFAPALELTEQALALDQMSSEAHVLRGVALAQLNRPEEATQAFLAGVKFGPQNAKAFFNLAVHHHQQGQRALSEEMARETLRINPDHSGAKSLLVANDSGNGSESQLSLEKPPVISGMEPPPPTIAEPMQSASYRSGYDASNENSLQFAKKMGKGWVAIGVSLALLSLIAGLANWLIRLQAMAAIGANFSDQSGLGNLFPTSSSWISVVATVVGLTSLVWMILDLIHRRGNWLWMLPYVICCCCGFGGICQLIYVWQGRK